MRWVNQFSYLAKSLITLYNGINLVTLLIHAVIYKNPAINFVKEPKMYLPEKGVLSNSNIYFHTPSNTAKSAFFYLKSAGEFFCNGDYRVERETFHSYLIMYIKSGNGNVVVNNRNYQAHANDAVILDCHQPHLYYTNTGWETLWVHFDGNSSKSFFELISNRAGVVIPMGETLAVHRCLSMIIGGFKDNRPLDEVIISCHIHRMLAEMLLISSNNSDYEVDRINPVLDAISYIHKNFSSRITLNDLAGYIKMSPFHFSRKFKKETGYSPYEYIIKTRIDNAKTLLKKTKLNIKEIAYAVGFNSESNFVNTFHQSVSLTPNDFRNTPV